MNRSVLVVLAVVTLAGCARGSSGIDGVQRFDGLSHEHVTTPVTYPQTPPVGGPHSPVWLSCDAYTEAVPNENAVHSMEHGAVWVTYRPDLPAADVDTLRGLQSTNPAYFLLSPYPGLPSPVVASTWGLQLAVDEAGDARLAEFVKKYAGGGQGGEPGKPCRGGATLDQLRHSTASPPAM